MMLVSGGARLLAKFQPRNKCAGNVRGLRTIPGSSQLHCSNIKNKGKMMYIHTANRLVIPRAVRSENEIGSMSSFLDSIKWDSNGLAVAIAQDIDTGEVLMQAFVDRNAVNETLQTGNVALTAEEL